MDYVARQGLGQLRLLRARRPITEVIADPATPAPLRKRLRLALSARQFGIDVLGLRDAGEFSRYVDTGGPVAYSVSAAYRTRFKPVLWHFPLVGSVPYLGFFRREQALAEAEALRKQGFDTYLRPVSGYSSLGYFLSPIYASMLDEPGPLGELRTVETVLHEMAHTTAYLTSASELNESFATLVGVQGAALYYQLRGDAESGAAVLRDAQEQERRALRFSAWLQPVLRELAALYRRAAAEHKSEAEILRQREAFFESAMLRYRAAFPSGQRYRRLAEGPLNNAVFLAFGVYHRSGSLQQDLLGSVAGDLRAFIDLYREAQKRRDAAQWLKRRAQAYREGIRPG